MISAVFSAGQRIVQQIFVFDPVGSAVFLQRLFENKSLIKNNKSFWVLPFSQKGGVLSKLLQKASP
ncbi:hypothetical protein, partial [Komagataeibacter swingsii]